jgi:2-succinyl-5-enolpyruvyl-6-hydroxy-3-cyclohexene-1-carboxylate synthase
VTFLHDANGLVTGSDEPRPDLTIVVANDDGGAIFATLEQGEPAYADSFERLFGTPHEVEHAAELRQVLTTPARGIRVVEVPLARDGRRRLDAELQALARRH